MTKLVRKSQEGQGIIFAKIFGHLVCILCLGSWALLDCEKAQFSPFNDININLVRHRKCVFQASRMSKIQKFLDPLGGLSAPPDPCCKPRPLMRPRRRRYAPPLTLRSIINQNEKFRNEDLLMVACLIKMLFQH